MKIERNIPIPPRTGRQFSEAAKLIMKMKIGDSLWLKKSFDTATHMAFRVIGKGKYSCRRESGGTRVWKIK